MLIDRCIGAKVGSISFKPKYLQKEEADFRLESGAMSRISGKKSAEYRCVHATKNSSCNSRLELNNKRPPRKGGGEEAVVGVQHAPPAGRREDCRNLLLLKTYKFQRIENLNGIPLAVT